MKKTLFFLVFLFPCLAIAQKKSIDGFMDIPFGSDSATVKAKDALICSKFIVLRNEHIFCNTLCQ